MALAASSPTRDLWPPFKPVCGAHSLVCKPADPAWLPLFALCQGQLSEGDIVWTTRLALGSHGAQRVPLRSAARHHDPCQSAFLRLFPPLSVVPLAVRARARAMRWPPALSHEPMMLFNAALSTALSHQMNHDAIRPCSKVCPRYLVAMADAAGEPTRPVYAQLAAWSAPST